MRGGDGFDARLMRFVLEMRQSGITDSRILGAMERTPRAAFVPAHMEAMAFDDAALPLPCGQVMSQPSLVGRMLGALGLNGGERVLEIGTGSGYQAAVLVLAGARVTSVERHARLASDARAALGKQRLEGVQVYFGDGQEGWPHGGPFDRIVINASLLQEPSPALLAQLEPGGVMVGGCAAGGDARLTAWRVKGEGEVVSIGLGPIALAPISSAPANPQHDCSEP
jgi:protein-L-isoaspartate(D-aspartate) O-methyltransferase